jgi:excinuclease ABC subunit C
MVVAEGGRPKNSDYRRFRISIPQNDDFASMAEVVERRYSKGLTEKRELAAKGLDIENGKFSAFPDLILIDGGRGQLNAARQVLMRLGLDYIPIIGLAKENEEIYIPDKPEPLVLPKDSPALQLLQRIRDEAHRFAISYHRSLRGKSALQSVLDNIPGIGDKRRKALMEYFGSIENIKRAGVEELASVEAMNISAAKKVYEYFHSI